MGREVLSLLQGLPAFVIRTDIRVCLTMTLFRAPVWFQRVGDIRRTSVLGALLASLPSLDRFSIRLAIILWAYFSVYRLFLSDLSDFTIDSIGDSTLLDAMAFDEYSDFHIY